MEADDQAILVDRLQLELGELLVAAVEAVSGSLELVLDRNLGHLMNPTFLPIR